MHQKLYYIVDSFSFVVSGPFRTLRSRLTPVHNFVKAPPDPIISNSLILAGSELVFDQPTAAWANTAQAPLASALGGLGCVTGLASWRAGPAKSFSSGHEVSIEAGLDKRRFHD